MFSGIAEAVCEVLASWWFARLSSLAVIREFSRASVFTFTGRLRASATFSARHNTMFQGLAADGAKLALWKLWRAGYRLVNFIHDEILVELPEHTNLTLHAEIVRHLMIESMQQVVPDVHIDVRYSISELWAKSAELVVDEEGRFGVWRAPVVQGGKQKTGQALMAMSA